MATHQGSFPNNIDRTKDIQHYILEEMYFLFHDKATHRPPKDKYFVIGDRVETVKEFVIHEFTMGDVDDPDLYAAEPLIKWEKSEMGQWVMEHAVDVPTWHRIADVSIFGYRYQIRAKFAGPVLTEYLLRKSK